MRQVSHFRAGTLVRRSNRLPEIHGGAMKIAAYWWGGKRHVGRLSEDGSEVTPLALGEAGHVLGALALIEHLVDGKSVPPNAGPRLPLSAVRLDAPFPRPRRNIFCVG